MGSGLNFGSGSHDKSARVTCLRPRRAIVSSRHLALISTLFRDTTAATFADRLGIGGRQGRGRGQPQGPPNPPPGLYHETPPPPTPRPPYPPPPRPALPPS